MSNTKKVIFWAIIAVIIIAAAIIVVLLTNPKDKKDDEAGKTTGSLEKSDDPSASQEISDRKDNLTDSRENTQEDDNSPDSQGMPQQEDNLPEQENSQQEDNVPDSQETSGQEEDDTGAADSGEDINKDIDDDIIDDNDPVKQLAFVFNEHIIGISNEVNDEVIESMLGKADMISEHTYSADDGRNMDQLIGKTEKHYQYPGLIIKTIGSKEDDKAFIFSIEITDSKFPTVRGIKAGDSFEELKEAYPEGNLLGGELSDQEDDYRYEPANYWDVMNFHIKDKKIESIQMYTLID